MKNFLTRAFHLYYDGFREMTLGKKLWALIAVKLLIMFGVLKLFFFPDLLESNYDNDDDRANAVRNTLVTRSNIDNQK